MLGRAGVAECGHRHVRRCGLVVAGGVGSGGQGLGDCRWVYGAATRAPGMAGHDVGLAGGVGGGDCSVGLRALWCGQYLPYEISCGLARAGRLLYGVGVASRRHTVLRLVRI